MKPGKEKKGGIIPLWNGYVSNMNPNWFCYENGGELCLDLPLVIRDVPPGKYRLVLERIR